MRTPHPKNVLTTVLRRFVRCWAIAFGCLLAASAAARAETLFAPGTITIGTNEAIVITTPPTALMDPRLDFRLDGVAMAFDLTLSPWSPRYYIAGPRALTLSNHCFMTFQRLQGSAVRTVVCTAPGTNVVHVPAGKTVQFLARSRGNGFSAWVVSPDSPEPYPMNYISDPRMDGYGNPMPSLTGPCDVYLALEMTFDSALFVSYYFTDEVLQVPGAGFLSAEAPVLEVNIEKSHDLVHWTPTGAFTTGAEAGAYYRLRMLK